jgi:inner membrane protein
MTDARINSISESLRNSHFVKVLVIGFLILLLQIPIGMVRRIIRQRQNTRDGAVAEVRAKWGNSQSIIGPSIVVPYVKRSAGPAGQRRQAASDVEYAAFLPESLTISGNIVSELRYRGIFEVPVYRMSLDLKGSFSHPDFSQWAIEPSDILWDRACLSLRIADARAMTKSPKVLWKGQAMDVLPSAGEFGSSQQGIHVKLKDHLNGESFNFLASLELNGSSGAFFAPLGRDTQVRITSNWPSPSFQGAWLPTNRTVTDDGFDATWNIPFMSRNYPQNWRSRSDLQQAVSSSLFGVNVISPVDHYRMSQRSVKYQILFLLLTFATLWLFEVLSKVRIHPVQYLLVGAAMCLFYLLELSLAEHFGFVFAYVIASAAVVVLVTLYSAAMLKTGGRGVIVGLVVTLLYIYLYVLLMIEDYALLAGSAGVFVALATVMFLTRNVDWYSLTNGAIFKPPADEKTGQDNTESV